jgi:hypothetical protein
MSLYPIKFRSSVILLCLSIMTSCQKDVDFVSIKSVDIYSREYTGAGTPSILYSLDRERTFSSQVPTNIRKGTQVAVKIWNGVEDIQTNDFNIYFSGSRPQPQLTGSTWTFTANDEIIINASVSDKTSLVFSHVSNGTFYRLNLQTKEFEEIFTIKKAGKAITRIKAFAFDAKRRSFFISTNNGLLYSANADTKEAAIINDNTGAYGTAVWNSVDNWSVDDQDSLIAVGDFGEDGRGIAKFSVSGVRSKRVIKSEICCGLGMLYDPKSKNMIIQNGNNDQAGSFTIQIMDTKTGRLSDNITFDTRGSQTLSIIAFAGPSGLIWDRYRYLEYGLLSSGSFGSDQLIRFSFENRQLTWRYEMFLGLGDNKYSALTYLPDHAF